MAELDLSFHASHEQFKPSALLQLVRQAADSGFTSIHCSDHLNPWNNQQGQSGYAWSWLGASMQANAVPHGLVCAPGQRYHPVIVAQAAATLIEMFGNRLWLSLGTGQSLNESVVGDWPDKETRSKRLLECVDVMRALWRGDTVDHSGLVTARGAKLYTRAESGPPVFGAAVSKESCEWVAGWADGLTTTFDSVNVFAQKVQAFRANAGPKPVYVKLEVSYARTEEEALFSAHRQWRTNVHGSPLQAELSSPEEFESASKSVSIDSMRERLLVSVDPSAYADTVRNCFEVGATKIIVHNVSEFQSEFLQFWRTQIAPKLSTRIFSMARSDSCTNDSAA